MQGEVVVKSVFSGDDKRDKHLLEADFLDEQKFPTMSLKMLSYTPESVANGDKQKGTQKGKLVALLTLHGKKKNVEFNSTLDISKGTPQLALQGEINITDFGIEGSMMNSNKVQIIINTKWQAK